MKKAVHRFINVLSLAIPNVLDFYSKKEVQFMQKIKLVQRLYIKQLTQVLNLASKYENKSNFLIFQVLLRAGANVDEKDEEGGTALHNACYNGFTESVKVLLDYNASNLQDKNVIPLPC